jgi:DNA mismatch repair protein MutL
VRVYSDFLPVIDTDYNLNMKIHILPDDVASQIAAGEVVERPASVVKELIENAIDAQATRIGINVTGAGKELIEVSDDGIGIETDQISLAVERHSTSKLNQASDLYHIHTLGFRGEALASIGSVSRLVMTSRNINESQGAKIQVDGGKIHSLEKAGIPAGTVVRVMDLFYNTPARLKFLKKDLAERQQIENLLTRYALAYPEKAIHLQMEGKTVFQTTGSGDRREILAQLFGIEFANQMLELIFEEDELSITGFISPISISRSNRKEITFFVNGRWIQDISMTTAVVKAYQTYLMVGRYPIAFLFVKLNPEDVDVNVHPAKAEVRFRQSDQLFTSIQRAIRRALLAYSPIPGLTTSPWHPHFETQATDVSWNNPNLNWDGTFERQPEESGLPAQDQKMDGTRSAEPSKIPLLRLIGQIGATYLVAEGPDGLYLIDQHAAHERVLFEKMTNRAGKIVSQNLIQPELIQLTPASARSIHDNLELLNQIGFSIEEFGSNSFRIRAVPTIFKGGDPQNAIMSLVDDFEEDETPLKGLEESRLIARICKRMAIKGGQILSVEEQTVLIRDLEACFAPRTCPHGRPTMIHLSVDLLERQFGRRGAR